MNRDRFFTPIEAQAYGLLDRVLGEPEAMVGLTGFRCGGEAATEGSAT